MNVNRKTISRYYRSIGPEYSKIYDDKEMSFLGIPHLPTIIGITGPTKSGKTMVAKQLVTEHGFHYECLSSYIREKAYALGYHSPNWETMRDIAKQWRVESGLDVLVNIFFQKLEREGTFRSAHAIVVDGILHPAEFQSLQKIPNTYLIAITSTLELRYKSTKAWEKNPLSFDEFIRRDQWERGIRECGQKPADEEPNIEACIALTQEECRFEYREGDGARAELFEKIDAFIKRIHAHRD